MGFHKDAYATIWDVKPVSSTMTKAQISISRKNKDTGNYDVEFSNWVTFMGTAVASKALHLHSKDRIKIGDCDVRNKYDKEKNAMYYNFNIFSFEELQAAGGDTSTPQVDSPQPEVDDGEVEGRKLPF